MRQTSIALNTVLCHCMSILINAHLPSWRVEDGRGRRRGSSWNLRVGLKSWRFNGVSLGLHHPNDALLCPRVVGHALLGRGVPEDKKREGGGEGGVIPVRAHWCFQISVLVRCKFQRTLANCNCRHL